MKENKNKHDKEKNKTNKKIPLDDPSPSPSEPEEKDKHKKYVNQVSRDKPYCCQEKFQIVAKPYWYLNNLSSNLRQDVHYER